MSQISGMFPGGPMRPGEANQDGDGAETPLRTGEDVEAGIVAARIAFKARRRRRSTVIAVAVAVAVAGGAGVYFGLQTVVTPEELTQQASKDEEASELDAIVDDVMGELRRMEELEAARNGR